MSWTDRLKELKEIDLNDLHFEQVGAGPAAASTARAGNSTPGVAVRLRSLPVAADVPPPAEASRVLEFVLFKENRTTVERLQRQLERVIK